jgi:predicted Zn-dependent peptidase
MVLCISGNTTEEEIGKVLDEMLKPAKAVEVERFSTQEQAAAFLPEITQKLSVSMPQFNIGVKCGENNLSGERFAKRDAVMSILLEVVTGKSTDFYKAMYDEGLINDAFGAEFMASRDFSFVVFAGESENPREVFARLKAEIRRLREEKIDAATYEKTLRAAYGKFISSLDHTESVVNAMIAAYFNGINLFDIYYAYERITLSDVNAALDEWTEDRMSISIIEPIKEEEIAK